MASVVSARNAAAVEAFESSHPGSLGIALDATDRDAMKQAAERIVARCGRIDFALYCAGHYAPMRASSYDLDEMLRHESVNYVGALYLLDAVLPVLIRQKSGHLSLVSSVAGYRGLPNSLAYGPTKAALINFAEALYLDLRPKGIGVRVINPGFVATPLTAQNDFAMPALLTAEQAALATIDGFAGSAFEIHYPKRFTRVMKLLAHLPYRLYFPLVRFLSGA